NHFEFLSSYTWSHAIDDSTDLQTLLEPQDTLRPDLERSNSTFDQRHRWVLSAVFQSPLKQSDTRSWRKFLAEWTVAPIVEASSDGICASPSSFISTRGGTSKSAPISSTWPTGTTKLMSAHCATRSIRPPAWRGSRPPRSTRVNSSSR